MEVLSGCKVTLWCFYNWAEGRQNYSIYVPCMEDQGLIGPCDNMRVLCEQKSNVGIGLHKQYF